MKKLTKILLLFLLLSAIRYPLNATYAAVPHLINYQGRLTDTGGTPLNGSYALTFRIYDAETAGNLLWEETQTGVVIQKGIFGVLLGSITNLDLPFDKQYYLEIKVGNEVMSPRQRITSAGYAIRAEEAEKLGGKQPSDYTLATDITSTPTANKAVKLDSNAKLPISALKVYDSGWFAISANSNYPLFHNLGTTRVLVTLMTASSSAGANATTYPRLEFATGTLAGVTTYGLTNTTISVHVYGIWADIWGGTQWVAATHARVMMVALE